MSSARLAAAESRRTPLFWVILAGVVVAQLMVLYALCSQQMQQASQREAAARVQMTAYGDCLAQDARATFAGCRQLAGARPLVGGSDTVSPAPRRLADASVRDSRPAGSGAASPSTALVNLVFR